MTQFKGIIFDMDGTLVDSEIIWHHAEAELFAARNIPYTDDIREHIIGMRVDEMFIKLVDMLNLDHAPQELEAELVKRMLEKIPTMVKPKSGAQAIIEWTAAQNIPYCIASSSPLSIIESTVNAQGWDDLIPHLYSADDVPKGKPAPDVYLYAAEKLGVNPSECLALEDSPNGAKSAIAAGMTCYVVPDSHSKPEAFAAITAHVYSSLDDILAKLKN
ncbi:MAG: HAD family phosphatase [Anaerolineae bacterium]|nr:HAD family phosphatase [Anaerolineae bacterium]MDQ7035596.1 HAD family phosphatase [Anaerolineae bacterium]